MDLDQQKILNILSNLKQFQNELYKNPLEDDGDTIALAHSLEECILDIYGKFEHDYQL